MTFFPFVFSFFIFFQILYFQRIKANGTVRTWGSNFFGQLGNESYVKPNFPVEVVGLSDVIQISAGESHSLALLSNIFYFKFFLCRITQETSLFHSTLFLGNGSAKAWGNNRDGQLGDGTSVNSHSPTSVLGLTKNIIQISGGGFHSLAIAFQMEGKTNEKNVGLIVGIVISLFFILFTLSVVIFYIMKKRKKNRKSSSSSVLQFMDDIELIEIGNEKEKMNEFEGVWKGKYTGKEVLLQKLNDSELKLQERIYQHIGRHPTILDLFGIYSERKDKFLVLEFIPSSLSKYLSDNRDQVTNNTLFQL